MTAKVQVDQAGRVVLPKKIRERFRLRAGDALTLEIKGEAIELRPQKHSVQLARVNGVLVVVSDLSLPAGSDLAAEAREERIDEMVRAASGEQ